MRARFECRAGVSLATVLTSSQVPGNVLDRSWRATRGQVHFSGADATGLLERLAAICVHAAGPRCQRYDPGPRRLVDRWLEV